MDVRCRVGWFTASTMTLQHHSGSISPQFSKNPPPPTQVYERKGAPICPSTAYQCTKTLYIYMIWMWDAEWGGLQPQPWHNSITLAILYLNFPIISLHLQRCIGVRVHPCTHPQHIIVPKHFICMKNGYEMQSGVVYSLNHDIKAWLRLNSTSTFH